jgi:hypothetical protein
MTGSRILVQRGVADEGPLRRAAWQTFGGEIDDPL